MKKALNPYPASMYIFPVQRQKSTLRFLLILLLAAATASCAQMEASSLSGGESANRTLAKEQNATTELPLLIEPFSTRMNFGVAHLERDISQEFTQPLEKEVWPAKELLLSMPEEGPLKEEKSPAVMDDIDFRIEIQDTSIMRDFVDYYTHRQRKTFVGWLQRAERYLPYVREVFREYGLPRDLIFLPFAESGYNPWAYSRVGAAGMWQFMPATARHYDLTVNWWVDERRDPYLSTHAAAQYLKKLYRQFGSWYLALAAYNAGEGNVATALRRSGSDGYFELCRETRYLKRETRHYVPKFLAILKIVKNLEAYNLSELSLDGDPDLARIEMPSGTDLGRLCSAINMEWDAFRKLNPSLRRQVTPPNGSTEVHLPSSQKKLAQNFLQNSDSRPYSGYARYRVQQGDSWWRLAKRFNAPIRVLKNLNGRSSDLLRPGKSVLVPTGARGKGGSKRAELDSGTYMVRKGDTLWEIARRFGVNLSDLRRTNDLQANGRLLRPGQRLSIPQSAKTRKRSLARERSNYTVQKGDSLWKIARTFGVSIQTLREANGMKEGETLQAGARLFIPGASEESKKVAVSGDAIVYTVRKGDNLWSIARKFGVSTSQILSWNDMSGERIHPGDELRIRHQSD